MKPEIQAIVSVTRNWAIGKQGTLAVKNPCDMARFKELTMGGTVIMGRKTLESLPGGKALVGRRNIVLTRDENYSRPNVEIAHGLADVKRLVTGDSHVWVIGGESVYRALLPFCNRCLVTMNDIEVAKADAWFPDLDDHPLWHLVSVDGEGDTPSGMHFRYLTYEPF